MGRIPYILVWKLFLGLTHLLYGACDFPGEPDAFGTYQIKRWVEGLERPVKILSSPLNKDNFYVVEQAGKVRLISSGKLVKGAILDIRDRVTTLQFGADERGLLGMAFHPRFTDNRRVFFNYTTKPPLRTRISSFTMTSEGVMDPHSEQIRLEIDQPYDNHNGGEIAFGPDGYLYIGMGDGGSGGDPHNYAQNLSVLLGKMLRIDVNSGIPYSIPPDNPFVSHPSARKEIYAYGLRNPWRFSFDRLTGELWAGDVGQIRLEEIDIITKGANYGWKIMEGFSCFITPNCNQSGLALPIFDYGRDEGHSVTGGVVYRGLMHPTLVGAYLFGDFGSGKIWALRRSEMGRPQIKLLATSGLNIAAFGEEQSGEILIVDLSGSIYKLTEGESFSARFPHRLSETGCLESLNPLVPNEELVAYEVNSPLWSDGTQKQRYVRVPEGVKVLFSATDHWDFPEGTVLLKNFFLPPRPGDKQGQILESRFLVKRSAGFIGYTYQWNPEQTEGFYQGGASLREVEIWEDGDYEKFNYYFPSSSDCLRCHTKSAGEVLGLNTLQAHRKVAMGTLEIEQIRHLVNKNIVDGATVPPDLSGLVHLVDYRNSVFDVEPRARSFLHSQCAQCHNPINPQAQSPYDMRFNVPLENTLMLNAVPLHGDLGVEGAKVLMAQESSKSLLYLRLHTLDKNFRMPPLATSRGDKVGIQLVHHWIQMMETMEK